MKTTTKLAIALPLLAAGVAALYLLLWLSDLDRALTPDQARRKGSI